MIALGTARTARSAERLALDALREHETSCSACASAEGCEVGDRLDQAAEFAGEMLRRAVGVPAGCDLRLVVDALLAELARISESAPLELRAPQPVERARADLD